MSKMSKPHVNIRISCDGEHRLEIQCAGIPSGILYCLAQAAAETIKNSGCFDDKSAAVSAFAIQMLEFLTEDDDDGGSPAQCQTHRTHAQRQTHRTHAQHQTHRAHAPRTLG